MLILAFVVSSNSPFSIVENKEFKDLISYVSNGQAKVPTTKTLMSDLDSRLDKIKVNLKQVIETAKYVCTTADIWTKRSISFMGVTIHFLDDQLNRKSYLLAFRRILGRHTHAVIAEVLLSINKEFNVMRTKITHIITDGASNFRKAFVVYAPNENENYSYDDPEIDNEETSSNSDAEMDVEDVLGPENDDMFFPPDIMCESLDWVCDIEDDEYDCGEYSALAKQLRCIAHSLNLIGSDFEKRLKKSSTRCFDMLNAAYSKLKRFWELNSRSTVAHEIILRICKRSFPCPNATRWNAKFDAIEVAEQHKYAIKIAIDEINREAQKNAPRNKRSKPLEILTVAEWKMLKDYTICMRPVAIALDIIQGEKRACLGYVLPTLYGIKASLCENAVLEAYSSDYGQIFHDCMVDCIDHRFQNMMTICDDNKELILAAAIHPNFKLAWIEDEKDREFAQNLLINSYVELANKQKSRVPQGIDVRSVATIDKDRMTESRFFQRLRTGERRTSTDDSLTFDIWKYMLQSIEDENLHQVRGITLIEDMFRRYNTSLASSAPVERIFSKALIIFSPRRSKISDENFEKVLFIHQNRDLFQ